MPIALVALVVSMFAIGTTEPSRDVHRDGSRGVARRAERELLAAGERPRERTAETHDHLTAQEAHFARLVRDGLSSPEIGARLFISPRTAEYGMKLQQTLGNGIWVVAGKVTRALDVRRRAVRRRAARGAALRRRTCRRDWWTQLCRPGRLARARRRARHAAAPPRRPARDDVPRRTALHRVAGRRHARREWLHPHRWRRGRGVPPRVDHPGRLAAGDVR